MTSYWDTRPAPQCECCDEEITPKDSKTWESSRVCADCHKWCGDGKHNGFAHDQEFDYERDRERNREEDAEREADYDPDVAAKDDDRQEGGA